jgi:hypothetical protein
MEPLVIRGRGALGGIAEGPALISRRTITGWGGVDVRTGKVKELGHPLEGMSLKGSVLILEGSRGSNGWSIFFHAAQVAGFGPATAAVLNVPLVTDLETDPFSLIRIGDQVRVDGDRGVITIVRAHQSP